VKYDGVLTVQTTLHRLPPRPHLELMRVNGLKADAVRAWRYVDEITYRLR
jgi:hypothetical protein